MATEPRQCDHEGCTALAVFAYQWDWGQSGVCCSEHQALHQQRQASLSRSCTFSLIESVDPPMERSERVKLKAETLVLEEELAEAKLRGLEVIRERDLLKQQCASLTMRDSQQKITLEENKKQIDKLADELETRELEAAEMADELQRLRAFVPMAAREGEGTDPGRNVVG